MHYIAGTKFTTSTNTAKSRKLLHDFAPNCEYQLARIYKCRESDNIVYVFVSNNSADKSIVEREFKSTRDGDTFLSKVMNESVPNYEQMYEDSQRDIATRRVELLNGRS